MKPRKNISVSYIKQSVNEKLANPNFTQDEKRAFCILLDEILSNTDN
jgi:hypothetical protein